MDSRKKTRPSKRKDPSGTEQGAPVRTEGVGKVERLSEGRSSSDWPRG